MNLYGEQVNDLLYVGFNQDNGCFCCGTDTGFRIFNVEPFREAVWRSFANGGIGIVEMLFRCNLIALVGGGKNPRYPTNKVFIWDDHQSRNIGELTFKTEVKAVKLRRDRVVVVLAQKTYVYRFSDLKMVDHIVTGLNPRGLVSLCADSSHNVLAVPGLVKGSLRVELYDINKATLIQAHETDLAVFALNSDGSRLASASEKGTLIRVWECGSGELLRELRRGVDRAEIYCLAFNIQSSYLACTSDKGTVHIFSLLGEADPFLGTNPNDNANSGIIVTGENGKSTPIPIHSSRSSEIQSQQPPQSVFAQSPQPSSSVLSSSLGATATPGENLALDAGNNMRSGLAFMKSMLPGLVPKYFTSEWSCAQIRGIEGKAICAFDRDSTRLHVVCADGTFLVYSFDPQAQQNQGSSECVRISSKRFVKDPGEVPESVLVNSSIPLAAATVSAISTDGTAVGSGTVGTSLASSFSSPSK